MAATKRFLVGIGGALIPVLISILAIDIGDILDDDSTFNAANILSVSIKYLALFIIVVLVAYLHEDETSSFKLLELGVVAPALLTSLISAQSLVTDTKKAVSSLFGNVSIIGSVYTDAEPTVLINDNLPSDVLQRIPGKTYQKTHKQARNSLLAGRPSQDTKSESTTKEASKTITENGNQEITSPDACA